MKNKSYLGDWFLAIVLFALTLMLLIMAHGLGLFNPLF